MTTILLVWYALWWGDIAWMAKTEGRVTLGGIVSCIFFAPFMPFVLPIALFAAYADTVLWRKP